MQTLRLIVPICLFLAGCAATATGWCEPPARPATTAKLLFGRNIEGTQGVGDEDWRRFVEEELTPRFPDGFTVLDGAGQWRSPGGLTEREASKVVMLVLPGRPDDGARLEAVRAAYKARFRQQSVLLVTRPACAAF